jgi:nitrogen regulatory protein P-II 2
MNTYPTQLLVIIGEAALEKFLVRDIKCFGAHGYTIADVRGGGEHGTRDAEWEGSRSIRMEVICEPAVAEKIVEHVIAHYAKNFSLSLYVSDVGVIRKDKY